MRLPIKMKIAALACSLFVTACTTTPVASPTPYKSAVTKEGYGYSSVQLTDNEYRVLFKATDRTPADVIQQYALRRAAELANKHNYEWLTIVKTDVDKKPVMARAVTHSTDEPQPFATNQQCTMSGCTEVAQPAPGQGQNTVTQTQINDVYFSILVRMSNTQGSLGKNAMSVTEILADQVDNVK
ncbi:conserved exported hypothetical protein [Alteromonas sp. 38]|uniref:CC0125/CC1285 family lipoprotein n=1 Tax=Alteromonas TaxID=226 RepID=UPI0012F3ECB0|nr:MULTISPECIES: hypothetical protein [Alteromonas]CAD5270599.1 conserved exported hypothetical protein [Alteromonas sp. 154]VXB94090.1 conserved exported hypothetical protein [Alteromonas sp. 38]